MIKTCECISIPGVNTAGEYRRLKISLINGLIKVHKLKLGVFDF